MIQQNKISFTIVENEMCRQVDVCENEYRNLMVLLKDKFYPDYFGECGGQGRCATCAVRVEGNPELAMHDNDSNEKNTLNKSGNTGKNTRLSCRILISPLLQNTIIHIDDTLF